MTLLIREFPAPTHWRDRLIVWGARWLVRPNLATPFPWAMKRRSFATAGWMRPMAPGIRYEKIKIAGKTGAIYTPDNPDKRIVWIHGGGFVIGSPRTHKGMLSHLAAAANAVVIVPKYRLAPEHPFPAAVHDIEAAFEEIDAVHRDLGPIILGGDSAGGTLAAVALAHALRLGAPPIAKVVLISPATDLNPHRDVPQANDILFPLKMFRRIAQVYAKAAAPTDPRLSPVHGDFTGAPEVLIQCCAGEYLEGDSDAFAARLDAQGVQVQLEKYQGLPHVFHFMAGSSPSADEAIRRLADFINAAPEKAG